MTAKQEKAEKTEKAEEAKPKATKTAKAEAAKPAKAKEENVIFIGKKPSMAYVLAIVTQFGTRNDVVIKARGRSISKAVDVAEIVRNKFVKEAKITDIRTGTDEITTTEGNKVNVSSIEIELKK